jgi:aryl-alcohol dehydrogenase-like predicted oxidoreductase
MTQGLAHYRLLGRSGLRVSPIALGTMTFGESWGADEAASRHIFDLYVERGGNFIDTANFYSQGRSEEIVGRLMTGRRDSLVLASKYSLTSQMGDPNSGGNHRKSMMSAIDASLKRLGTDYLDLYYLHVWDGGTPVDEIMRAFDDLVRAGKVLYVGISDTPAWQVSRMQMLAELRGWTPFAALQIEYSLVQRTVERDLIPMAAELGLGVLPWSPLAGGLLSGKYSGPAAIGDEGRGQRMLAAGRVTDQVVSIATAVAAVAERLGRSSSEVALAWTLSNSAVTAPIIGVRTHEQLKQNLCALDIVLTAADLSELDTASAIDYGFPHDFLSAPRMADWLMAGTEIRPRVASFIQRT